MPPTLKSLNEQLTTAFKSLERASQQIDEIPFEPTRENIGYLTDMLTRIAELQKKIYVLDPKLRPDYLRTPPPYPEGLSRQYGEILLKADDAQRAGDVGEAIRLIRGFLATKPPKDFIKVAEVKLQQLIQSRAPKTPAENSRSN